MNKEVFVVQNEVIVPKSELFEPLKNVSVVYEVLRIIDRVPLFFNEHFDRMANSCRTIGFNFAYNSNQLLSLLFDLTEKNNVSEGNIMLKVFFDGNIQYFSAQFIAHAYPDIKCYANGVEVGLLYASRINPEAKVVQSAIRDKANMQITETGVYEVLLVNENNEITEGSRSNLFFVKNGELFTSPLNNVLKGITLSKVIDLAKQINIFIHYKLFNATDMVKFDSAFLTGTSPRILPISKAGNICFDVENTMMRQLMLEYNKLIALNIEQTKKLFKK